MISHKGKGIVLAAGTGLAVYISLFVPNMAFLIFGILAVLIVTVTR